MTETSRNVPSLRRILVADPSGEGARLIQPQLEELKAEMTVFDNAALLTMDAARHGGDLIVIFRPDTLLPLERLRNDPRTRHIPVLLSCSTLDDDEKHYLALVAADQLIDYPAERELLLPWISGGRKRDFHRGRTEDFANAKLSDGS